MVTQGLLFSEPSIAETGVWCSLSRGIDPAEWSRVCRFIGTLNARDFEQLKRKILPRHQNKAKSEISSRNCSAAAPLISIGPSGIGGRYQRESF